MASSRLSTSNWRTIASRPAPSEVRMAISRRRDADRASSRLATLKHAIASNTPTAAYKISSEPCTWPVSSSRIDTSVTPLPLLKGCNASRRRAIASISAACRLDRRSRTELRDDVHEAAGVLAPGPAALEPESAPHVVVGVDESKAGGHDADDLDRLVVQLHHPANRAASPSKRRCQS